jgi:AcrR family transcriptional regulator
MNVRKKASRSDPRVLRSRRALGDALVELLHERRFDDITVQDILDRASVGRATFYAHYRNKQDVLHSGLEHLFTHLGGVLERGSPGTRLVPVREFLEHMQETDVFVASLRASGRLDEMWELSLDFVADMVRRRIEPRDGVTAAMSRTLVARMLAAAFMEMGRWWLERPVRETPERLDATFHALASAILLRSQDVVTRARERPGS